MLHQRLIRPPSLSSNTAAIAFNISACFKNQYFSEVSHAFRATPFRLEKSKKFKHLNPITPDNAINPLSKPLELDKSVLHVVSCPIGNVKDFSIRSLEVLRQCDYIVCTNRNATKALLNIVDIDFAGRLIQLQSEGPSARAQHIQQLRQQQSSSSSSSSHLQSSSSSDATGVGMQRLVDMLRGGRSMALVAPSGTPCIADGGTELVQQCILNDIRVVSVPGPSAIIAALSVSGTNMMNNHALLATRSGQQNAFGSPAVGATAFGEGSFFFGGHLSEKAGIRARQLRQVRDFSCPVVFYDVPRRIVDSLTDMAAIFDRRVGDVSRNIDEYARYDVEADEEDEENSQNGLSATLSTRDRSARRPRRVTVLHEVTKFNESAHSGSSSALLKYYSQMGRSTQLTELGQLMIVIDGVATSDLVQEEQLAAEKNGKHQRKSAEPKAQTYFKSSVFGRTIDGMSPQNGDNADKQGNRRNDVEEVDKTPSVDQNRLTRRQKMLELRKRLRQRIAARKARAAAKALIEREAVRRLYEGSTEPTPLP